MWFNNIIGFISRIKGLLLDETAAPTTTATAGGLFVSDGTGGLNIGDIYYRYPASGAIVDLIPSAGTSNTSTISFLVGPGVGITDSVTVIPANSLILNIDVEVNAAYDPGATIIVGSTGNTSYLAQLIDVDLTIVDVYNPNVANGIVPAWNANSVVRATRAGASAGGSVRIIVTYTSNPLP